MIYRIHKIDFLNSVNHVNPVYFIESKHSLDVASDKYETISVADAAWPPHMAESLWLSGMVDGFSEAASRTEA